MLNKKNIKIFFTISSALIIFFGIFAFTFDALADCVDNFGNAVSEGGVCHDSVVCNNQSSCTGTVTDSTCTSGSCVNPSSSTTPDACLGLQCAESDWICNFNGSSCTKTREIWTCSTSYCNYGYTESGASCEGEILSQRDCYNAPCDISVSTCVGGQVVTSHDYASCEGSTCYLGGPTNGVCNSSGSCLGGGGGGGSCPTSYTPTINSVNQPLDQDISWSGASAESYNVYFGTSSPGTFIKNQTATSYDPGALVVNTKYYWKVQVKKGVDTVDCAVQNFTTTASSPSPIISGVYWQFSTQDAAEPSFTINAQSPIYTVATNEPNSTKSLITLTSLDNFSDDVNLSFSSGNECVAGEFEPVAVQLNPGSKQTNYSSFWIKTTNCTAGTIKITITGTPTKDPAKFKAVDLSLGIVTPPAPIVEETTRAPFWRQIIPW